MCMLFYGMKLTSPRVSHKSKSYVSYVVKGQHLSLRGLRKQKSKVYFYLSKFCCGLGQLSMKIILCVCWLSNLVSVNTMAPPFQHVSEMAVARRKFWKVTHLELSTLFWNHMFTASGLTTHWPDEYHGLPNATWPGKYGHCVSGNEKDMDTEEPR